MQYIFVCTECDLFIIIIAITASLGRTNVPVFQHTAGSHNLLLMFVILLSEKCNVRFSFSVRHGNKKRNSSSTRLSFHTKHTEKQKSRKKTDAV